MTTRNDDTPTHPAPIDVLSVQLDAFRADPSDGDAFVELRVRLREGGNGDVLATICELHAPHMKDPVRAADVWSEAGEARLVLGQRDAAERDLRAALALDPANERASSRLVEALMVGGRFADAAEVIEDELTALAARADAAPQRRGRSDGFLARRGQRHRMAAQIWDERLGRVDRALWHWQQAWRLEPDRPDALGAARAIYASLGDDAMVATLYQAELDVVGERGPGPIRAQILLQLGKLAQKAGDAPAAAEYLEKALRLDPDTMEARETLAEVYASAAFAQTEGASDDGEGASPGARRAGELFVDLGRRRLATRDDASAINYLRRALGVDPYSRAGTEALEEALIASKRWDELERLLRHRAAQIEDPRERAHLLSRRIALYERELPNRAALIEALGELAAQEPRRGPASQRLRQILREDQAWEALATRIESELDGLDDQPDLQVAELLELATIAREHLADKDRAAELLHRALTIDPASADALARYADHFRERRDWRGLADLYEFAFDNARDAGDPAGELVRRLEEIAQIAELRLGDVGRAIDTWRRIDEIEPGSPKAREALRRLMARAKMWEQLVGVLEQEASSARTPEERAEALRRIAQTYRERQVEPRRAIALYEEVATIYPDDDSALKALGELYEREGDDGGLAATLRRQLELDARRLTTHMEAQGRPPGSAREWPVAKRVERLTQLRRLAAMCETRLGDVDGVVFASTGVLEILPGDRDALDRMERVLEKAGDTERLEQTLEYHAASATGPAERAKVLRRLARLAADAGDDARALERWEQTLKAVPTDHETLEALAALYERAQRWGELAQVLEKLDAGRATTHGERARTEGGTPLPGSADATVRVRSLERYARVVDDKLGDAQRATRAWQRVLEISPRDENALAALARLHRSAGRWRDLAEVLAAQIAVLAADEPAEAAASALERAQILEERLGAPAEAIKQLERLVLELDPTHLDAHTTLRRLHEARGDFEAAVRIAEREMYLAPDPERKIARGLEIGLLCRDRLNDPTRALQAFHRVIVIDSGHDEALAAAADLHAKVGDWVAHVGLLERRIALAATIRDRRALLARIATATAERLGDAPAAFAWWRRAHDEQPDAASLAELRRAAETYGLWRELGDVLGDVRRRLLEGGERGVPADPAGYVAISRELAQVSERRLGDRSRALTALLEGLEVAPRDATLLAEAERIAAEGDASGLWKQLLDVYQVVLERSAPAVVVELLERRARVLADRLNEPRSAVIELLAAFAWAPEREETRAQLHKLAEPARAWHDLLAVEAALVERATSDGARIAALRRKAAVLEDHVKDLGRAFRTHLVGFLIAPEDGDTVAHLWRLARAIGRYRETDRTPRPEPAAAAIHGDRVLAEAEAQAAAQLPGAVTSRPSARPGSGRPGLPRLDATEEIDPDSLIETFEFITAEKEARIGDSTQPIDLEDLEVADPTGITRGGRAADTVAPTRGGKNPRLDRTMQLGLDDLVEVGVPTKPPAARSEPGGLPGMSRRQPPAPPARAARIESGPHRAVAPPPSPRKSQVSVRRSPLPQLPVRAFDSPWDEFAAAYDALPAADAAGKLRWLFRAAEVWETGAGDVSRAFLTLSRALAIAPQTPAGDGEVRARLHRLAQDHQAWDRLADLYETLADGALSAAAAADLLMEVAAIRVTQGRPQEAEAQYRRVLGMRPDDEIARARLENLYRAEGRWVELAASLEERTDPRLGTAAPEAERPALLRELAAIYTENLSRPHDAIDALERLRHLAPGTVDVLRDLGDLYARVGRWSKVIEVHGRICDIADGTPEARESLRRIAHIYEDELELPERAMDAYAQLTATWPDDEQAWARVDALYEAHARWADLSEVLRRRAGLTREPRERAILLARRARVLMDWLGAPEEAAAVLRHARSLAPDEPTLADALVAALVKSGREREAAAVLESRIEAVRAGSAAGETIGGGDLAALHIRLAQLRAETLDDEAGARTALDEALRLVPDHPNALALLTELARADLDPRAFADAKLREAERIGDDDAKIDALMAAGEAFRDGAEDPDAARAAFERVLALRPYHAEATWALAGLIEKGGDPDSAAKLLEHRLEDDSLPADEKARIYTQLAALARNAGKGRGFGGNGVIELVAERRLEEALGALPGHLPAVVALADLYDDAGRWDDLEQFVREILADGSLESAPPAAAADLHRRLAGAYEKLGREEDAYQTLLAADRLHRGHLLIKLALGENRYKARRWREASLHLSALAGHESADKYPAEVAQGLYHAALAEIRSLRPEKAPALYLRALELKANYAPALQALAEIAMEQGDYRKAADLLTRQATATEDPAERSRLFEALGDMAVMMLHDEERARICYDAAVQAAQPLEARHIPLLEKLLERCDLAGDHLGAGRTAELMAAFGATPAERASRFVRAAQDYLAGADRDRARAAAERAAQADPYDLDAAGIAGELASEAGDHEAAATVLGRALSGKDEGEDHLRPRRAQLWQRLGAARLARGDQSGASGAFEKAIAMAGDSDGAQGARKKLVEMWRPLLADDPVLRERAIEHLRAIAEASASAADVAAWADELRRAGNAEVGRLAIGLAQGLGAPPDVHFAAFLSQHPAPAGLADDENYRGELSADERAAFIADEDEAALAPLMAAIAEGAGLLWPDAGEALARAGAGAAKRITASVHAPAVAMFPRVTAALGTGPVLLYAQAEGGDTPDVEVVCSSPAIVVLGGRLLRPGLSSGELRFLLGRAAELARPERVVAVGQTRDDLRRLLASLARAFGGSRLADAAARLVRDPDVQRAHDEVVRTALPVKLRGKIEAVLGQLAVGDLDPERYLAACQRAADRAGMLLSDDPAAAVASVRARGDSVEHVVRAITAPGWIALRARLGVR
jgi:Tfp pilus assembly protein PilF